MIRAMTSRTIQIVILQGRYIYLKFMFSKKATKIEKNIHRQFDTYLVNVKSTVKIWSIFVAFLENMNFKPIQKWWLEIVNWQKCIQN